MQTQPAATPPRPWSTTEAVLFALILLLTLGLRLISVSNPYFVDGPAHVRAIQAGTLFIQPPGYFLFAWVGKTLAHLTGLTPALALRLQNLLFGCAGVAIFAVLCRRRLGERDALLLTLCMAVSPMIWFTADVHSTYAAMTFFGPLLYLCFEDWQSFPLGMVFWALMVGFRPSDGVFALPWVLWQSLRFSWRQRLLGLLAAVVPFLCWWIPSARHFGSLLAPIASSGSQVGALAHGVLTGQFNAHTLLDEVRIGSGMLLGWGLLLPVVLWALVTGSWRSRALRSVLFWTLPGLAFFALYYISDPIYLAYFLAPGLLAAGLWLATKNVTARMGLYTANVVLCLLFMLGARPVASSSNARALLDAYMLKFTRWGLRHEYDTRLATLLGACGQKDVQGSCKIAAPSAP